MSSSSTLSALRRGTASKRYLVFFALVFVGIVFVLQTVYVQRAESVPRIQVDADGVPIANSDVCLLPECDDDDGADTTIHDKIGTELSLKPSPLRDALFPVADPTRTTGNVWIDENHRQLKALFTCIELDNCKPNQAKVIILHSYHFQGALWGWTGGEDIWARSTVLALKNLGYTYLYAEQRVRALQLYQMFPDLVKAILMEASDVQTCFDDNTNCAKSHHHPDGFPLWKMFSFFFWTPDAHPMGSRWVLAPENYTAEGKGTNTYLGYSVEPACMKVPYIPSIDRPRQGYVMAKKMSYFGESENLAWPLSWYAAAKNESGVQFLAGVRYDPDEADEGVVVPTPEEFEVIGGIKNVGNLPQEEFMSAVARSRVLVGVGLPWASPTPYEALCLGVPFINPVMKRDPNDPTNRMKWDVQHAGLKFLDPPYVYNVYKGDKKAFVKAVTTAMNTPIDRYILPRMSMKAVTKRVSDLMENDWYAEASALLADRHRRNQGPVWVM